MDRHQVIAEEMASSVIRFQPVGEIHQHPVVIDAVRTGMLGSVDKNIHFLSEGLVEVAPHAVPRIKMNRLIAVVGKTIRQAVNQMADVLRFLGTHDGHLAGRRFGAVGKHPINLLEKRKAAQSRKIRVVRLGITVISEMVGPKGVHHEKDDVSGSRSLTTEGFGGDLVLFGRLESFLIEGKLEIRILEKTDHRVKPEMSEKLQVVIVGKKGDGHENPGQWRGQKKPLFIPWGLTLEPRGQGLHSPLKFRTLPLEKGNKAGQWNNQDSHGNKPGDTRLMACIEKIPKKHPGGVVSNNRTDFKISDQGANIKKEKKKASQGGNQHHQPKGRPGTEGLGASADDRGQQSGVYGPKYKSQEMLAREMNVVQKI